ncbi:unnamed protein product [Protopolystoma xenopodis]|uniref:Uncharacterized protein n=1 Tax=Protopolystoma xenopodis TaxID=117903 RepID=A0A448WP59_9PLAT|nr:unnamed protein product [Protopolystoma xenopodis]
MYVLRERPTPLYSLTTVDNVADGAKDGVVSSVTRDSDGNSFISLNYTQFPHSEVELDNLTEFNTAHNRRISSLTDMSAGADDASRRSKRKRPNQFVHFNDTDEVINPEDVDPNVGRFRNLVQETFIPNKRAKGNHEGANLGVSEKEDLSFAGGATSNGRLLQPSAASSVTFAQSASVLPLTPSARLATRLGLPLPNLAPEVDEGEEPKLPASLLFLHSHVHPKERSNAIDSTTGPSNALTSADILGNMPGSDLDHVGPTDTAKRQMVTSSVEENAPKKKKYAKEAWPGKRPGFLVGPSAFELLSQLICSWRFRQASIASASFVSSVLDSGVNLFAYNSLPCFLCQYYIRRYQIFRYIGVLCAIRLHFIIKLMGLVLAHTVLKSILHHRPCDAICVTSLTFVCVSPLFLGSGDLVLALDSRSARLDEAALVISGLRSQESKQLSEIASEDAISPIRILSGAASTPVPYSSTFGISDLELDSLTFTSSVVDPEDDDFFVSAEEDDAHAQHHLDKHEIEKYHSEMQLHTNERLEADILPNHLGMAASIDSRRRAFRRSLISFKRSPSLAQGKQMGGVFPI